MINFNKVFHILELLQNLPLHCHISYRFYVFRFKKFFIMIDKINDFPWVSHVDYVKHRFFHCIICVRRICGNNSSFIVSQVFFLVMVFPTERSYKKNNFSILIFDSKNLNNKVEGLLKNTKDLVFYFTLEHSRQIKASLEIWKAVLHH